MAGGKEVRTKIASVKNTQKITKAMEMVAASKMRKAQDRMLAARPYSEKIRTVISHLAHANPEYKHPYLVTREEVKRIGLIVVSTDRGLCGGLNANMFRMLLKKIQNWEIEGKEIDLCVIGTKAAGFFGSIGVNIIGQVTHIGDEPNPEELIGTIMIMLNAYRDGDIDEVHLVSNQFVNSIKPLWLFLGLLHIGTSMLSSLPYFEEYLLQVFVPFVLLNFILAFVYVEDFFYIQPLKFPFF